MRIPASVCWRSQWYNQPSLDNGQHTDAARHNGVAHQRGYVMHVISVNVGLPHEVDWKGKRVSTGIFKEPVAGRIVARRLNLDGDRQADLTVHGGEEKAVYVYPA